MGSPAGCGDTAAVQQGMELVSPAGGYNTAGDQLEMQLVKTPAGGYCCAAGEVLQLVEGPAGAVMDDGGDQELMDGSGCGGAGAWQRSA